jgi:hypothetical protein
MGIDSTTILRVRVAAAGVYVAANNTSACPRANSPTGNYLQLMAREVKKRRNKNLAK